MMENIFGNILNDFFSFKQQLVITGDLEKVHPWSIHIFFILNNR